MIPDIVAGKVAEMQRLLRFPDVFQAGFPCIPDNEPGVPVQLFANSDLPVRENE